MRVLLLFRAVYHSNQSTEVRPAIINLAGSRGWNFSYLSWCCSYKRVFRENNKELSFSGSIMVLTAWWGLRRNESCSWDSYVNETGNSGVGKLLLLNWKGVQILLLVQFDSCRGKQSIQKPLMQRPQKTDRRQRHLTLRRVFCKGKGSGTLPCGLWTQDSNVHMVFLTLSSH